MQTSILFVDDEEGVRKAIRRMFHFQQEFKADFAANGEEALEKLRKQQYQIIVSDQSMPGMSGDALLEIVKNEYPNTIRLILTAHGTLELATRAMNELETFGFLQKPIKKQLLFNILRRGAVRYQENMRLKQVEEKHRLDIPASDLMKNAWILLSKWDETFGPTVEEVCPEEIPGIDLQRIAVQVFMGFPLVYGQDGEVEPSQITIPLHYLKLKARIHFDAIEDSDVRGGYRKFAIVVLAPIMKGFFLDVVDSCMMEFANLLREGRPTTLVSLYDNIKSKI